MTAPTVMSALRSPRLLKTEVLAGLVVALALIPEAIAFSIIAGVDPPCGAVRILRHGRLHRIPRRPPGNDLRRYRCDSPGHCAGCT